MRLNSLGPSTSTTFVDSESGQDLLQIASDADGALLVAYHLFDECGALVAESEGLQQPTLGLEIQSAAGDVLLAMPTDVGGPIQYRLYGSTGSLLTCSDGVRTMIYSSLRMENVSRSWVRRS